MNISRILRTLNVLVLAALLAGCAAAPQAFLPQASAQTESSPPAASSTTAPADTPAAATLPAGPSAIPQATATPDLRLPPEQWQDWPVAPAATGRAIEIYRQGLALGNDPRHFSKVGDCQSIKEVLMGIFDRPGFYQLTPEHAFLKTAIEQFAGSFNRDGMAVQGGFNAASVLSPLWANPDTCKAGENPLECEFRVHKPSFVIISLEVWWNGRTPERYEQYMRRIIEFAIAKGVVPILSTKADNVEGNHSINLATARLAYEYDLPLWNWWRAAQDLDNGGLDPTRPDGFHISNAAWTPRAFTALEALDSVWHGVTGQSGAASIPAETPAAAATASSDAPSQAAVVLETPGVTPTFRAPTPGKTPIGGSGRVFFGLGQRKDEQLSSLGVYALDLQSGHKTQLAGDGYNFQAISPDGQRLLVNHGRDLYVMNADGGGAVKITSSFFAQAGLGAFWLPEGEAGGVIYLSAMDGGTAVLLDRLDGTGWKRLTGASDQPVELYQSGQDGLVYWGSGSCQAGPDCTVDATGISSLTGGATHFLEGVSRPVLSPSGSDLAYSHASSDDKSILMLQKGVGEPREAALPGTNVLDTAWSPDGKRLAVLMLNRSDYSGKWGMINMYLFTPANSAVQILPKTSGLNARAAWSPDGQSLLTSGTDSTVQGYQVNLKVVNLRSGTVLDLTGPLGLSGPDLLLLTNAAWLPVNQ